MLDEYLITWICPDCGAENTDDYVNTAIPHCGDCDFEDLWDEVITSEQMAAGNAYLRALEAEEKE